MNNNEWEDLEQWAKQYEGECSDWAWSSTYHDWPGDAIENVHFLEAIDWDDTLAFIESL